jgi:hypothetical protein
MNANATKSMHLTSAPSTQEPKELDTIPKFLGCMTIETYGKSPGNRGERNGRR